ncbi:hypothetical protein HPB50_010726 [Hyalomma asiaticum]|uniref:Uncharacterized protein n=1 Tax=Hyalomma asiaticum TaxID=266040 RepID=A0ACB7TM56_HYAAI|nr:hypothetical protein HPB50_010726 [Hyalomma asiaticum]
MHVQSCTRVAQPSPADLAMERVALRSTIASCLVLVVLSLSLTLYMLTSRSVMPTGGRRKLGLCLSHGCRLHARLVSTMVDTSRDPCDDLEAFACSKWAPQITDKFGHSFGYGPALSALELAEWLDGFKNEISAASTELAAGRRALAAFEECMSDSLQGGHRKRLNVLIQFMKERRITWPEPPTEAIHPLGVLLDLAYNWNINLWFGARSFYRAAGSKTDLLLNVGDMVPFWYIYQQDIRRENYAQYWEMFHALFTGGAQSDISRARIQNIATVEADIFRELTLTFQRLDKQPAQIAVADMGQHTPAIPSQEWREQLDATVAAATHSGGRHAFESVALSDKTLLDTINKLFGNYTKKELLQQISWFFVQVFAPLGNGDIFLAVYKVKDAASLQQRMFCATEVEDMYGPLVSSLYVAINFDEEDRKSIDEDLADVTLAAHEKVAGVSSLSNATHSLIASKLDTLQRVLWPPDNLLVNSSLTLTYANFSSARDTFVKYWVDARKNMARLYHAAGPTDDPVPRLPRNYRLPFLTYDYLTNRVHVSVAALSKHVFTSPNGTAAMRLGTVGFKYARELVRVFDNAGLRVDAEGNVLDEPLPFPALNSSDCTIQEDDYGIQELPALEVAYAAFEQRARNSSLHTMEMFTEEQVFFITACLSLCRQPKTLRGVFTGGCNEAAANFEPFSVAFNCSSGARMNPARKCTYFK